MAMKTDMELKEYCHKTQDRALLIEFIWIYKIFSYINDIIFVWSIGMKTLTNLESALTVN